MLGMLIFPTIHRSGSPLSTGPVTILKCEPAAVGDAKVAIGPRAPLSSAADHLKAAPADFNAGDKRPVRRASLLVALTGQCQKPITQHGCSKTAAPRIDPAQDLVARPNEKSAAENYFEGHTYLIRWMPHQDQGARHDHNP